MMDANKKRKPLPLWMQFIGIVLIGAVVSAGVFFAIKHIKTRANHKSSSNTEYQVTFAYNDGTVIDRKQVKEGKGVIPPDIEVPGVFQGWSTGINNVRKDIEAHPLFYQISDENLFCFDSVYAIEGNDFDISIILTGIVNISSADIAISYDPEVMEYIGSSENEFCKVSLSDPGELLLTLRSNAPIKETTALSEIKFRAIEKDVYSSSIQLSASNALLIVSGEEIPVTVSTLNNTIYYLQEVD